MDGVIELKNVTFRFPSREEVPVMSADVFSGSSRTVIVNLLGVHCSVDLR